MTVPVPSSGQSRLRSTQLSWTTARHSFMPLLLTVHVDPQNPHVLGGPFDLSFALKSWRWKNLFQYRRDCTKHVKTGGAVRIHSEMLPVHVAAQGDGETSARKKLKK